MPANRIHGIAVQINQSSGINEVVLAAYEQYGVPAEGHTPWLVHYPTHRTLAHPADWPHSRIRLSGDDWLLAVAQRKVENGRWAASLCTILAYSEGMLSAESKAVVPPDIRNILRRDRDHQPDEELEHLLDYIILTPPVSKPEAIATYHKKVPQVSRPALEGRGIRVHQKGTVLSRLLERSLLKIEPDFADYTNACESE